MYLKVRVKPEAKKEKIEKISAERWLVSVCLPAERNLANNRVRELVATEYGLNPNQVKIISGHQQPNKILSLPD